MITFLVITLCEKMALSNAFKITKMESQNQMITFKNKFSISGCITVTNIFSFNRKKTKKYWSKITCESFDVVKIIAFLLLMP